MGGAIRKAGKVWILEEAILKLKVPLTATRYCALIELRSAQRMLRVSCE